MSPTSDATLGISWRAPPECQLAAATNFSKSVQILVWSVLHVRRTGGAERTGCLELLGGINFGCGLHVRRHDFLGPLDAIRMTRPIGYRSPYRRA